ncbi:ATP-binding protein [Streptosporangium sp. NPDC004379]|uniref:ATP-binding protein n=1 Tax=Streptosporangium sp. NPDC004379 TaxID=3366189 RepID=UPI003693D93B
MRVSILGPLEVTVGHDVVRIGGTRLKALLIRLAVDVGHPVATGSLVDALWPEAAPEDPAAALQSLMWRLRRALPDERIVRSGSGWYRLDLPPEAVDACLFERLADEGRRALRTGDAGLARSRLREASALWRGEPLIDAADAPYAVAAAVRLRELRLAAIEDRVEADLACGPASPPVAELTELTAAYPLRERLCALLIRALDADGRPAEALALYEDVRRRLADELGCDPGPEVRRAHLAVLRGGQPDGARPADDRRDGNRPRGNLRTPLTSFVGRAGEVARIHARLEEGRLVTLVGPGGVGKTRLATESASRITARTDGGVWLVELASVTAGDVARAVLTALGPREVGVPDTSAGSGDPVRRLVEVLASGETLLVLDNCEHVIEAVAGLVGELLARCPRLRVLATGREPLGVTGERLCPVPPLPLPDAPEAESPATRLFADRAAAVSPGFALTEDTAAEVTEVCRRLDGLPLAIELAAARLRTMTLGRLLARLDDRFRVLAHGARSAPERHRTLRAVVAWSWDLLSDAERARAARLAVFPSSFTAEAADRVGVGWETLDTLVDRSLLQLVGERYRMLATIREYGLERLADSGLAGSARVAHAACFLELAERAAPHLRGAGQPYWLGVLTAEEDNLLTALDFAAEAGNAATARRLGAALGLFWAIRGGHAEAADRLRTALTVPGAAPVTASTQVAAQYLFHAVLSGRVPDAEATASAAGTISPVETTEAAGAIPAAGAAGTIPVAESAEAAGTAETAEAAGTAAGPFGRDADHTAATLVAALLALLGNDVPAGLTAIDRRPPPADPWHRGMLALTRAMLAGAADGGMATMRRDLAAAAAAFRDAGERWGLATSLTYLGLAEGMSDDARAGASALEESITLIRDLGGSDHFQRVWLAMLRARTGGPVAARAELLAVLDERTPHATEAMARLFLADLSRHSGEPAEAAAQIDLAAERLGDGCFNDALLRLGRGRLALSTGDLHVARAHLREAFTLASSMPDMPMVAQIAVGVAELALRSGAAGDAASVLGAAHALRGVPDVGDPDVRRVSRELRAALGPEAYRAAYDRGRGLGRDDALAVVSDRLSH